MCRRHTGLVDYHWLANYSLYKKFLSSDIAIVHYFLILYTGNKVSGNKLGYQNNAAISVGYNGKVNINNNIVLYGEIAAMLIHNIYKIGAKVQSKNYQL